MVLLLLMFKRRNTTYNLRNFQEFEIERKITVYFGLEAFKLMNHD